MHNKQAYNNMQQKQTIFIFKNEHPVSWNMKLNPKNICPDLRNVHPFFVIFLKIIISYLGFIAKYIKVISY